MAIGVVGYAVIVDSDVMPWHLARNFKRTAAMPVYLNEYPGGESQRRSIVTTSRSVWELQLGYTVEWLQELKDFWDAHGGPRKPFYFYDVGETDSPPYSYDPLGTEAVGKFPVRFNGTWSQTVGVGQLRAALNIQLVELAIGPG